MALITAIQRYSIHDGDGIRTTVFFKGCPLRCIWCHNPETQSFRAELLDHPEKCVGCGACVRACPAGAITMGGEAQGKIVQGDSTQGKIVQGDSAQGKMAHSEAVPGNMTQTEAVRGAHPIAVTERRYCAACGKCTWACPEALREIAGKEMTAKQLLKELLRDRIFYEESGGGVTFSGGEVLAGAFEEIFALAEALKKEGISLYVDTCGEAAWERFERIAPFADVFLYDLKCVDPELHLRCTGAGNQRILENLVKLSRLGAVIDLRIPLIRDLNGTEKELEAMLRFLREKEIRLRRVHFLPYHNTGIWKYAGIGRIYGGASFSPPLPEELARFKALFQEAGYNDLRVGG